MTVTAFALGRVIWEARLEAAWGGMGDPTLPERRKKLNPWPPHEAHPNRAAEHDLAIDVARALLKAYTVTPR